MSLPPDCDVFRVPVGPGAVHVERYGYGGPPVVLVHGFGTSAFLWRHVAPALAVQGLTAYALDLLGYGASDRPADADYGIRAQADYLDRAMTALQLPPVCLAGMDLGAIVALRLAGDRPERVARLVLVGPPPLEDIVGPGIRDLQRDSARHALRLARGLFGAAALLSPFLAGSVEDPRHMPPVLIGRYLAPFVGREGASHLLALAGAVREEDADDLAVDTVAAPATLLRGTRDRWCTKVVAEAYAELLPSARYEPVDAVGRLLPEEAPEVVAHRLAAVATGMA